MKKLILSALLTLSVLASFAQTNTTVLRSRVTDSTTVTTVPTDWGAIYYNAQDNKWRVYENGAWRDLGSGTGGGATAERKDKVVTAATYEISDADNGYNIHFTNASGTEVTIPAGLMDSLYFTGIRDDGAGQVDFTDDGTSVLQSVGGELSLEEEIAAVTWFKRDEDTFQGFGLLGPAGGGGAGTWGSITGDIEDQQDLLNYVAESIDSVVVSDGDKGDITVSSTGTVWTIDNLAVTAAKLATLSSSDLAGKLTDETGSGAAVFGTAPVINPATNAQTGSYTLVLTDASKYVDMNVAGANNVTVPPNSSVAFPIGTTLTVTQVGAGLTSIVQGSGVTVTSSAGILSSPGQSSPMVLRKTGTNTWYLYNGRQVTGSALTKLDDTNVTMTLTGTPLTALLQSVSLELGWTGQLSASRGGTGTDTPSGTYTPTLTNVTNVAASTAYTCTYLRIGNTVTVSGRVDIDPTSTGSTQLGITLPVVSAFTTANQCGGTAATGAVAGHSAAVRGDATNDRAEIIYVTTDTASQPYYFTFTYQVL